VNYQERVSTIADIKALYERVIEQPRIRQYRGYTEQRSYGYDPESGEILNQKGEFWFDNPEYDPIYEPPVEDDEMQSLEQVNHGRWTAKHPHYNWQRGMLCPTCDKALWDQIEIKGIFFKKKITIKDQPNFCKFCGQKLKAAY
jgi:hypothetical protein